MGFKNSSLVLKKSFLSISISNSCRRQPFLNSNVGIQREGDPCLKILRQNPKRTDLWSVYLDQEIRLGDTDLIRALFERATSLSLPAKKMKFLFKKYLDYEERHGNEERANYVKQKAMSYVENTVA